MLKKETENPENYKSYISIERLRDFKPFKLSHVSFNNNLEITIILSYIKTITFFTFHIQTKSSLITNFLYRGGA